jgi:tetratricopeptide (TPR) repeat protein
MLGAFLRRPFMFATFLLALSFAALPALAQTGAVRGKVVDAKGQPVQGATVRIESIDGGGRKFQLKTDRRGEFIQIGLQPGPYRFTAEKDNLSDVREQRVSLDQLELTFTLAPGSGATDEDRKKAEARVAAVKNNFAEGVALSKQGRHDEAIARFEEVLKEAPKCSECYTNIAAVYIEKKDLDRAEESYRRAIEVNPNSPDAYNGLASLYNSQKKFNEAAEASAMAQKLSGGAGGGGGSASAMYNQGVIAWNATRVADAKKAFEESIRLDPNFADAHYWLGMANLNEGNLPEAAKAFEAYLKLAPTGQYADQAKGVLGHIQK